MSVIPTPRLLLLALVAAIPLALGSVAPLAFVIAGLYLIALVVLVACDLRLGPRHEEFAVARHHDQRLSLDEPNDVTLSVRWSGRKVGNGPAHTLWLRDETPPEIPGPQPILEGAILPGGEWLAGSGRRGPAPAAGSRADAPSA